LQNFKLKILISINVFFFSFDEFLHHGHKNIKSIGNGTKGFFGKNIRKSPHFEGEKQKKVRNRLF
jgi:hypothetical protein